MLNFLNEMIKCYHARKGSDNDVVAPLIAVIDGDDFLSMTNYKDIFNVKFTPDYRGYCNDDLIVEMDGEFYVALSFGWKVFDTFEDALDHCKKESFWVRH